MVKELSINASYGNRKHLFVCSQHEFLQEATKLFNCDIQDVDLYLLEKGRKKTKITPNEIGDLMSIEIVPKNSERNGRQRTLRSQDEYAGLRGTEGIITKLRNNTPLNGIERKSLIEYLQDYSYSKKRKVGDISSKPEMCHKKVQVHPPSTDSVTQTDFNYTPQQRKHSTDESINTRIKKLAHSSAVNKEEAAALMRETYDDRRNFILLKVPPVCAIRDKYPLLFCLDEIKNELGRLFYAEKCDEFISNIHDYAELINQKCDPSHELSVRTEKQIKRVLTDVQKNYARAVGSIFILTWLMNEEWTFIHLKDYPHGSSDIYPHIDASDNSLKDLYFDNYRYGIIVEEQLVCKANNLLEAILCLLAAFFIFNIDYPESCRQTLIAFEKLYLGANDTMDLDAHTEQMIKLLKLELKTRN